MMKSQNKEKRLFQNSRTKIQMKLWRSEKPRKMQFRMKIDGASQDFYPQLIKIGMIYKAKSHLKFYWPEKMKILNTK